MGPVVCGVGYCMVFESLMLRWSGERLGYLVQCESLTLRRFIAIKTVELFMYLLGRVLCHAAEREEGGVAAPEQQRPQALHTDRHQWAGEGTQ